MANTVISPNMNMPVPVVGVDPGEDWATNIVASLSVVDSHNHTSGQGVQITPQGIDINADLPMNGNNLTTARSVRFSPQAGTISGSSDLGCLYENGVDLYFVDGAGNQVRITQGGAVTGATGTITGLPSGTASASFAGSTFTFQSATNTPATISGGTVIIGQTIASGKTVTIAASGSQAANYNLTLPIALPSVQSSVVSDGSGNLSFLAASNTTYTPTISNTSGGSGFSAVGPFMVTRIGNNVSVAGAITFSPAGKLTACNISLPIVRTDGNFTGTYQAVGNTSKNNSSALDAGYISANTSGPLGTTVDCFITGSGATTIGEIWLQFTYSLVNI